MFEAEGKMIVCIISSADIAQQFTYSGARGKGKFKETRMFQVLCRKYFS